LEKSRFKNASFGLALLIVIVTVILMVSVYTRFLQLHILIEEFYIHHWLSWTGTLFIAFFTPAYYLAKRRAPSKLRTLLKVHVFGNLIAVMFVSIHFTQQISRPPQAFPQLGTGIVLYAAMILLVLTGFFLRFRPVRYSRFWHTSVAVSFYLIIVVHVLHGLGII
jgi:protein-S-isoprenylcysteine O-methyltransferase Ste14